VELFIISNCYHSKGNQTIYYSILLVIPNSTMVSSTFERRSNRVLPVVHRASSGLTSSRHIVEESWNGFLGSIITTTTPGEDKQKEIAGLFSLILLAEEMAEGGYAARALRALEVAEERSHWDPRRSKPASDRKFSEVIGHHFGSDSLFKRYFRMNRECFNKLCSDISSKVGEEEFRPESSLGRDDDDYRGAVKDQGGVVSGEVRVAVCLRLLAGASYLDLMVIFNLSHRSIFRCFHLVVQWVNQTFEYPLIKALVNKDESFFEKRSEEFAMGASDGIFNGCFGALDGLAIRIKKPTRSSTLPDPGAYYCRKGFHALNCQAICDNSKRILWMSSAHQGSCHDSSAFQSTKLNMLLSSRSDWLLEKRWFIVGDSAYSLESYLLVPFDKPDMKRSTGQKEDAYNFYHSNCRIRIECAFGEMVMRWGIFWKKLQMDIGAVGEVVSAAGLLHNFIIDQRTEEDDEEYFSSFSHSSLQADGNENNHDHEVPVAMVTGNEQPRPAGRPTVNDRVSRENGKSLRRYIAWNLDANNLTRPNQHGFKYNSYGMVYME
jgi:hypothetical protein